METHGFLRAIVLHPIWESNHHNHRHHHVIAIIIINDNIVIVITIITSVYIYTHSIDILI